MAKLEWLATFETGLAEIDEDHREMLGIMQATKDAVENGENDRCSELLKDLLQSALMHFGREEEILRRYEYPELEEHIRYHHELFLRARAVKRVCEGLEPGQDISGCVEELAGFLVDDIIRGDSKFVSHLIERGAIKRF